jgi:hypothetical protein
MADFRRGYGWKDVESTYFRKIARLKVGELLVIVGICSGNVNVVLKTDAVPNFSGGSGWRTLQLLCPNGCAEQTQVAHGGIRGGRGAG